MSTEQNYVGRGNYANTPPQTAKNGPQTPSMPDGRADVLVSADAYEIQTRLLTLIDDFWGKGGIYGPVEVINNLLYRWLTMPTTSLELDVNRNQLHSGLALVNFLTELYELRADMSAFEKGGVSNGE
jgi:hypothetical protein